MENENGVEEISGVPKAQRDWAMYIHFSSLIGYFTMLGFVLAPLVMWLVKKDESDFIVHHGKEAVNFQITMLIYWFVVWVLCFVVIGFLLLPVVILMQIILTVIAGVKAKEGEAYRYPCTIRFVK